MGTKALHFEIIILEPSGRIAGFGKKKNGSVFQFMTYIVFGTNGEQKTFHMTAIIHLCYGLYLVVILPKKNAKQKY